MLKIREAKSEDLNIICNFWQSLREIENKWNFTSIDSIVILQQFFEKDILNCISVNNKTAKRIFLAEIDEHPIGCMKCEIKITQDGVIKGLSSKLYILDEYRQNGYGAFLIEFSLKWFKANNCEIAELWVHKENNEAKRIYEKFKFLPEIEIMRRRLDGM